MKTCCIENLPACFQCQVLLWISDLLCCRLKLAENRIDVKRRLGQPTAHAGHVRIILDIPTIRRYHSDAICVRLQHGCHIRDLHASRQATCHGHNGNPLVPGHEGCNSDFSHGKELGAGCRRCACEVELPLWNGCQIRSISMAIYDPRPLAKNPSAYWANEQQGSVSISKFFRWSENAGIQPISNIYSANWARKVFLTQTEQWVMSDPFRALWFSKCGCACGWECGPGDRSQT